MKVKDIKEKNVLELRPMLENLKKELFNLRFLKSTGQLSDPSNIRKTKKSIARIMTVLKINISNRKTECKNA